MIKRLFIAFMGILLAVDSHAQQYPVFTHADSLRGELSPERACYKVLYYDLHLKINPDDKSISGYNMIAFKAIKSFHRIQIDLFKNMVIDSIVYHKGQFKYTRDSNAVLIDFIEYEDLGEFVHPSGLRITEYQGKKDSIKIYYHGTPQVAKNPPWDGGFIWSKDSLGNPFIDVACEGTGASLWWPCKDYIGDKPDSMRMTFDVPTGLMCISNGRLRKEENLNTGYTRFTWFVSVPIINYDVTLNIADYAHISDYYINQGKDTLTLDYYVLKYNKDKAIKQFAQVKTMLACYESFFGNYPFYKDGYKLVETTYWGMEHQSCVAYGNHYKNTPFGFDFIIIHESAHEWWGNNVSCSDPADMWIHEAFATYAEALYVECTEGYQKSLDYLLMQQHNIKNTYPIIGPYGVNFQGTDNDDDMYYKGTWVLHTFRHVLNNDSLFFRILKDIQTKFRHSSTDTKEILTYINKVSGKDYTPFFTQYLYKTSPPVFEYKVKAVEGMGAIITYRWDSVVKGFEMPLKLYFSGSQDTIVPPVIVTPTTEWQTTKLVNWFSGNVSIDTNEFYVIPKKEE